MFLVELELQLEPYSNWKFCCGVMVIASISKLPMTVLLYYLLANSIGQLEFHPKVRNTCEDNTFCRGTCQLYAKPDTADEKKIKNATGFSRIFDPT